MTQEQIEDAIAGIESKNPTKNQKRLMTYLRLNLEDLVEAFDEAEDVADHDEFLCGGVALTIVHNK